MGVAVLATPLEFMEDRLLCFLSSYLRIGSHQPLSFGADCGDETID